MPVIIEGEAIVIDDGSSDQHSIIPSWLEPLPDAYKARRAWIALGAGILTAIFFAYLSWKLYLLHQLLSGRGALTFMGVIVPPAVGISRWKFWINHPEVRCYAKITQHSRSKIHSPSDWLSRLLTNPLSELTPEALADYQYYEAERRAEFRHRWQNRITWLVGLLQARDIRFAVGILILVVDFMLRYNHQISIIEMGSILLVALLIAYEMIFLFLIYVPIFFLVSRYIPYTILVPMSVAMFIGAMGISIAIKAESRN
ncbi:MAG TPA: hypothetical protein VFF75_10095 [Methylophilaceae bacterium]|nr:hypothetical protein [Methylophilaceae bacterium]